MIFRKFLDIMFFQIMHKKIDMLNKKLTFLKDVWKKRNTTYSVYFIGKKFPVQVSNVIKKKTEKNFSKLRSQIEDRFIFTFYFSRSFFFLSLLRLFPTCILCSIGYPSAEESCQVNHPKLTTISDQHTITVLKYGKLNEI